ncbi:MAG TPA: amidohydrolase [Actinomycetota bacterium]|nr:amidohydrolase [Actinomycetota bacterium]
MAQGQADLVLRGGAIYTVDAVRSWAQAVAVRAGEIAAVGSDDEVAALVGPRTEVVELRGRMVVPGFQDAHVHASAGGLERIRCDLSEAHTLEEYLRLVREYAERNPSAEWILGGGWAMDVFPGGVPRREDLDRAVPDRPVFLSNRDHHGAWVNSRALEIAGVTSDTPDPADGRIERDERGAPIGTLQEGAMDLVGRTVPRVSVEEQRRGILEAERYLFSLGVTAWQEAIVGEYAVVPDCFDAYVELSGRGELTAHVVGALWWERGRGLDQLDGLLGRRAAAGSDGRFRATSIKIMQDGVLENFTGAMLSPYLDAQGDPTQETGISYFDPEELKAHVARLDAEGFQVHVHAIGDRAVREALDAIEAARRANGFGDRRHHIAHIQVIHPDDLRRFRALGVVANAQPLWACNEPQMTELTVPFLGPERARLQYPFRSLARSGAVLAVGSDWPVSSPNPLWEIHVAVNRTIPPGYPYAASDSDDEPFLPDERLDLPTALAAATMGSAYVNHLDGVAGSIEVGKRADLVVLDRNLFEHPAGEIAQAAVDLTLVGGRVVFER